MASKIICADMIFDPIHQQVSLKSKKGKPPERVELNKFETRILWLFLKYQGRVLREDELLVSVWPETTASPKALHHLVDHLCQKLPTLDSWLVVEVGVGYRFGA